MVTIATRARARLADIVEHGSDADALRAMEAWLARVYGRPTDTVVVEAGVPASVEELRAMPREQKIPLLAEARERRAEAESRAQQA